MLLFGPMLRADEPEGMMNLNVLGVYREAEFSPGKVADDAAIIDAALAELERGGADVTAVTAEKFVATAPRYAGVVLAMCQSHKALNSLASVEKSGAVVMNTALAIRNCYRDLLGAGLMRAGVPVPEGALVSTTLPLDPKPLRSLDLNAPLYVKRGDLHALGPDDVSRVAGYDQLEVALASMGSRGVRTAYVQQEFPGEVVKFYGVSGSQYFAAMPERGTLGDAQKTALQRAAAVAAEALGLEVWGGDALFDGNEFAIVDFNDWPSFSRVRDEAARAIARRSLQLLGREAASRDLSAK
jgi:glutathione synthase/RimK-type ligase-like ATP-grasp enzyme